MHKALNREANLFHFTALECYEISFCANINMYMYMKANKICMCLCLTFVIVKLT